jgi:hypothetical protein
MSQEFEDRALEDKEFDEYLRRGTEVSQRYQELGAREVPPVLDTKVLRQAQQQAAKSSGRRRPWLRWGAPLAFAATALIAITVVMQPEVNAPGAPEPRAESQVFESRATDSPVAESPQEAGNYPADRAPRDEALAVFPESGRPAGEEDSVSSNALQARRAAKPTAATQPPAQPGTAGSASARADSSVAQDRDLRDEPRGAATELERSVQRAPAPAEPGRPSKELEAAAQSGELQKMTRARESASQARLDEPAAAAREESKAKREQAAGDAKSNAALPASAAPAPAPAPPAEAAAGLRRAPALPPPPEPAPAGVSTLEADRAIAPAVWIRWIRDLLAQGDPVRAQELLIRLRAAHPSFELPADSAPPPQQR